MKLYAANSFLIPIVVSATVLALVSGLFGQAVPTAVSTDRIRIGTLLPSQGPLAETGAAMRDVLVAHFSEVNAAGGIHARKLDLQIGEAGADASELKRLLSSDVFALVGGVTAGNEAEAVKAT